MWYCFSTVFRLHYGPYMFINASCNKMMYHELVNVTNMTCSPFELTKPGTVMLTVYPTAFHDWVRAALILCQYL